jgi:SAM-dependent methyltransferase
MCPFCKSPKLRVKFVAAQFTILECKRCQIATTTPPPTVPAYEKMDFHSGEDPSKADVLTPIGGLHSDWRNLIRTQVKSVADEFPTDASLLEIGCGEGILLEELTKAGFGDVWGFEPSNSAAKRARRRGLQVLHGYFDARTLSRKFDLILMSHVYEHIEDAEAFLEQVKTVLKPGGGILLTQTNHRGLVPTYQRDRWYAWVPDQHFWHFTPRGLDFLLRRHGFRRVSVGYCPLVHPEGLIYRLARMVPWTQDQFIYLARLPGPATRSRLTRITP